MTTPEERVRFGRTLLDHGAKLSARDDEILSTPLAWAEKYGHNKVAEMLRVHGATA